MLKKVKMRESICSSEGWVYVCGQIVEIDAVLAEKWVASGTAEYDSSTQEYETATVAAPEIAILHDAKRKR